MPSNKKLLQAAAGNAGESLYVEDVFSTNVYTGNGSTQTITNGIDLAGEGGLVWTKRRSGSLNHFLVTTDIATNQYLSTDLTSASGTTTTLLTPASDGFAFSSNTLVNANTASQVAWTFRKAEKFFDVVTYTGTGSERTVSHNLGAVPRIMIIKKTNGTGGWWVYSKDWVDANSGSLGVALNLSNGDAGLTGYDTDFFWGANPTDSVFSVGTYNGTNGNTDTFVAYLFASDAGGFGDDGTENIIKCGSYTGNGSADGPTIDCGFEPQWLLIRNTSNGGNWVLMDAMRGMPVGDEAAVLVPNASGAESGYANLWGVDLQATGFKVNVSQIQINESGGTMIYIAIRRPMKTPEAGTEVFQTVTYTGNGSTTDREIDSGKSWKTDLHIHWNRTYGAFNAGASTVSAPVFDSLRGYESSSTSSSVNGLATFSSAAEASTVSGIGFKNFPDFTVNYTSGNMNEVNINMLAWQFKRATGFMDVVAYSGDGAVRTVPHNLGVVPELMIVKKRNAVKNWYVYSAADSTKYLYLNGTNAFVTGSAEQIFGNDSTTVAPTSSVFSLGSQAAVNGSGDTFINYLFASVAGVSKVGSYTGTGSDLNVDCGFSAGARFILIKRTDSTGDWYVWDSERGIVAGNDPYLLINSSAAEVTNTDYIDPLSSGFTVTSSAPAGLNASGGSYIFLAIA